MLCNQFLKIITDSVRYFRIDTDGVRDDRLQNEIKCSNVGVIFNCIKFLS